MMENSDYIVDIGPLAGRRGGEVVFQGTYEEMLEKEEYIERALEDFGKYKFGDGESVIQAFGKVLAAVIIDETIGKRGGSE